MNPTYPGVYIQEAPSPVHPITGVATSIAAFVGYTDQGIDNRAEELFSYSDFERLFGGLASDSELSYAVQQFFNNGGAQAYVVRVPKHNAKAASIGIIVDKTSTNVWTFFALSSGSWADGDLLVDIDFNGIGEAIPGLMKIVTANVTGTATQFTALEVGQWLQFAADSNGPRTLYQIKTITDDTHLVLQSAPATVITGSTTAAVYLDNQACNLTITNQADGTVESFPDVSFNPNNANFIGNVLNDPDTGSQMVNVTPPAATDSLPPVPTGIVGTPQAIGNVLNSLCGGTTPATVTVTANSSSVTSFTGSATPGQLVMFDSDPDTLYTVASLAAGTLTLTSPFLGVSGTPNITILNTVANADFYLTIGVQSPATEPAPLPVTVKVFSSGVSSPAQSLAALAAQIQTLLNNALSVALPGSSVQVSAVDWSGTSAIRLYGVLPNFPDAVFVFTTPATGSDLAASLGLASSTLLIQNVSHYALGTGNLFPLSPGTIHLITGGFTTVSTSTLGYDGSGLPQTADLIGDPSQFTGIYALEKVDLFNQLCMPDATRALPGNPNALDPTVDPNSIYSTAIAYCDQRRAFLLLDAPPNINTATAAIAWKTSLLTVNDPNGAAYFPRLRLADPLNNSQLRTFAPCGVVAGLYSRIDASRGVWKAPAGTEATLTGVQTMVYKLTDNEQGAINPLGLNCARIFPVYGPVMWGARTLVGADVEASQWKYVPVRRLALYIEESLYRGTKWVVFEPNDEPLWASIRLNVGAFMDGLFRKQAFQGQTADQAYFVKCDDETTTQADIDLGIVNILVGFAPLEPAEFVVITISQMSGQAQS
jgi:phage tail sheath protein FI